MSVETQSCEARIPYKTYEYSKNMRLREMWTENTPYHFSSWYEAHLEKMRKGVEKRERATMLTLVQRQLLKGPNHDEANA